MCGALQFAMPFFFLKRIFFQKQVLFVSRFCAKYFKIYYAVCGCGFVLLLNECDVIYTTILL